MNVLLFTGAGASYELGVPTMRPMVEQFRDHLHDLALPADVITSIDRLVADEANDMEYAIDLIDRLEGGFRANVELGKNPDESEIIPYRIMRNEAEWFVQHSCERVASEAAVCMWSPLLRMTAEFDITIATTNYDRAVEIAASRLARPVDDGFEDFAGREIANWVGFNSNGNIQLLKLHGSTDWYRDSYGQVVKLRHPMPLFGDLQVLPASSAGHALRSALVLPSREKLVTESPFQSLATQFRVRARDADIAVFVGSSLRDPHMRDVCVECASRTNTLVVSRTGVFAEGIVPSGATVVKQSAGRFLTSTLPMYIRNQDSAHLSPYPETEEPDRVKVIDWLVAANHESHDSLSRCNAIEMLAQEGIALSREVIDSLMRSDDPGVSIFALGLIPLAEDRNELLDAARMLATTKGSSSFSAECERLTSIIARQ